MNKKMLMILPSCALLGVVALAAGGVEDPLASLSYLTGTYTAAVEEYFADQFPLRDEWISLKTRAELLLGKKDVNNVYFGKNGWLLDKYKGTLSEERMQDNLAKLGEFTHYAAGLLGEDRLTGGRLRDTVTGEETDLAVDGLFISIGRSPETALFAGQIELDDGGYIVADESTRTNLPGVFAVGDVRTKAVRQVITAAADGAVAAHYAEQYLAENG